MYGRGVRERCEGEVYERAVRERCMGEMVVEFIGSLRISRVVADITAWAGYAT